MWNKKERKIIAATIGKSFGDDADDDSITANHKSWEMKIVHLIRIIKDFCSSVVVVVDIDYIGKVIIEDKSEREENHFKVISSRTNTILYTGAVRIVTPLTIRAIKQRHKQQQQHQSCQLISLNMSF